MDSLRNKRFDCRRGSSTNSSSNSICCNSNMCNNMLHIGTAAGVIGTLW